MWIGKPARFSRLPLVSNGPGGAATGKRTGVGNFSPLAFLQTPQSRSPGTTLPFRTRGNEYGKISSRVLGKNPDECYFVPLPRWQQSRGAESVVGKSRRGLRDIVPASDLAPFRTSPRKNWVDV